jgi:hypothetical protein
MSQAPPPPLREKLRAIVPQLIQYSNEILYGSGNGLACQNATAASSQSRVCLV